VQQRIFTWGDRLCHIRPQLFLRHFATEKSPNCIFLQIRYLNFRLNVLIILSKIGQNALFLKFPRTKSVFNYFPDNLLA